MTQRTPLPLGEQDQKDHFITRNGLTYAGGHLIIDFWGAKGLGDCGFIETTIIDAIKAAKATLLHIHLHTFGDGGGVSGVAVLAESHISVHTWPEREYAAYDIFMCGDSDPRAALKVLEEAHEPTRTVVADHQRGVL